MSSSAAPPRYRMDGATLASLLHSAAMARRDVDGLLFGHRMIQEKRELTDGDEERTHRQETVAVTCVHCSTSSCSFYDKAGDLLPSSPQLLAGLEAQYGCPLLGWLVVRQSSGLGADNRDYQPLLPSMRETSVTRQLSSLCSGPLSGSREALLAVISLGSNTQGSTHTYTHQLFKQAGESVPLRLRPVELQVTNIGLMAQHTSAQPARSPVLPTHQPAGRKMDREEQRRRRASQALQTASAAQTAAVEAMYDQMLEQLEAAARAVAAGTQEAEKQRQLNLSMRARLGGAAAGREPPAAALKEIDLNP